MYIKHKIYIDDINNILANDLPWDRLSNKHIFITGSSGMVGTLIVDVLMEINRRMSLNIGVIAGGRNESILKERFASYIDDINFALYVNDVSNTIDLSRRADYIIHAASNTHPRLYALDPIGTMKANIFGTYNILEYAKLAHVERVVFLSSVEIYGQALKCTDIFDEKYCGYIDCNTVRAGYPESKRAGEAMCNAYISKWDLDVVIPRISRIFGSTMRMDDSKAMSQFLKKGIAHEDIVLKSNGEQRYSYCYVSDAVSGIFYCLLRGEKGEAYNVAASGRIMSLYEIAQFIADISGKKVIFELPDVVECVGASKVSLGIMNVEKLEALGWHSNNDIKLGIKKTLRIFQDSQL